MGNLGGGEMLVIFFVALVVLGPNKLPEAARQVGRAVNEIRRISGGFQREMREAMNEPIRAAEEAKSQIIDPFGQAKSSAGSGAAGMPKAGGVDEDPPLPSVQPAGDTDEASAAAERPPLEATPIPTPPAPFTAVTPPASADGDADPADPELADDPTEGGGESEDD